MIFPKCTSIHTLFMRFRIDVVFVDGNGTVVEVCSDVRPWRLLLPRLQATHTIEMAAGVATQLGFARGQKLECKEVW
jgi:uncharacterized membrane protein (UPF0127 family)